MKRVLVTSGDTRVAYSICKCLSKQGYQVYIGERHRFNMASVSRYCAGTLTYSSPFTQQEQFIGEINAFCEKQNIDIILPVLEESYTLAKHKALLHTRAALFLPDYSQILAIHDKGKLTAVAESLGLPVPQTWELEDLLAAPGSFASLPFPVILKPKQGGGGWGMRKFYAPDPLETFVRAEVTAPQNCIVQTIVEGQLIGVCGIFDEGKCLASDSYISTTVYPLRVGQPTTRLSAPFDDALQSFTTLLEHLRWKGVCEIDFIVDQNSGVSYMLDANPRFWGSITQNIAAGVPYPLYYCRLAQGETIANPGTARPGTRTRWLGGDLMRLFAELKQADSKWASLKEAFRASRGFDANDDWDLRDPFPFVAWGVNMVAGKLLKRRKDALPGIWE